MRLYISIAMISLFLTQTSYSVFRLPMCTAASLDGTYNSHISCVMYEDGVHSGGKQLYSGEIKLHRIGRYQNPDAGYDEGAAEIVSYDYHTKRLFVSNAQAKSIDVLDLSDPAKPNKVGFIDTGALGGGVNSVSAKNGIVVAAVEADTKQDTGLAAFYWADDLSLITTVKAGALPDMLTFTPDAWKVLVANEGEPSDDYSRDPEGSITIIDLASHDAIHVDFHAFNGREEELRGRGVKLSPGSSAARNLEPEYITVSPDGGTAYITLQENNALAVMDVDKGVITDVVGLGYKNHNLPGNELDVSDRDAKIQFKTWPVSGMYQPDAVAAYQVGGQTYVITANEGDARDYAAYSEEARVKDIVLDSGVFPNAADLQTDEMLGRLKITTELGDSDADGDFDALYTYGARSFSIWDAQGRLLFDSGNQFALITANSLGDNFNPDAEPDAAGNLLPNGDGRSDDKGAEPEAVAVGWVEGQAYAFIGLERSGGIMVYNVSNPMQPRFVQYLNEIEYGKSLSQAGDVGPEGMAFVSAEDSPNGYPLLIVGNEVSGTTVIYQIDP